MDIILSTNDKTNAGLFETPAGSPRVSAIYAYVLSKLETSQSLEKL